MISLEQFGKAYHKPLFSDLNIDFPDGQVHFLMGKNGCGKTTLFKCIAGLERFEGKISFNGKFLRDVRQDLFVLWDNPPFYGGLSGVQNLMQLSDGHANKHHAIEAAERFLDMETLKRKVKTYSYGQRKKLALALMDILQPNFILMDEISNGLDIDAMQVLQRYITEQKAGRTIILTGHQFAFYQHIADCVYVKKNQTLRQVDFDRNDQTGLERIYHEEFDES